MSKKEAPRHLDEDEDDDSWFWIWLGWMFFWMTW